MENFLHLRFVRGYDELNDWCYLIGWGLCLVSINVGYRFAIFFFIYVFILLHIQLMEHREFMFEYYNSRYLSAVLLESDVFFPMFLIAMHCHCCDHTEEGFAIIWFLEKI